MPRIKTGLIGRLATYRGRLLQTGQTTQYSSELDDGYYEKGLTKRYLILTTGQHSGVCSFTLDGKTETQSHNCVRDLVTGLMWARYTSAESASVGPDSDGKMDWADSACDAFQYVAAANAAELGGYSDWRLPNPLEWLTLPIFEAPAVLVDPTAFPSSWDEIGYWTSSTRPDATDKAYVIRMDTGGFASYGKDWMQYGNEYGYYVALVRGGL